MNVKSPLFLEGLLKVITEEMTFLMSSQKELKSDGCGCSSSTTTWNYPCWSGDYMTTLDTIPKCCQEDKIAKAFKIARILVNKSIIPVASPMEFIELVEKIAKEI